MDIISPSCPGLQEQRILSLKWRGTGNYSLPAISKRGKQIDKPLAQTKDSYEIFVSVILLWLWYVTSP